MKQLFHKLKKNINDMDKVLLTVTIFLLVFGLLNIVTASSRAVVLRYNTSLYSFFYKQAFNLILGAIVSMIIVNIPTKKYKAWSIISFGLVLMLLIYLSLYGTVHKGSINWIKIFGFTLQPSELAKPTVILCLSVLFEMFTSKLRNKNIKHFDLIGIIVAVGCIFPLMVFFQKDLGTAIILLSIFTVMFFASPILRKEKLKTFGLGIVVIGIVAGIIFAKTGSVLSKTQLERFDFFDPFSKY